MMMKVITIDHLFISFISHHLVCCFVSYNNRLVKDHAKETILYGQSVGSGPSCYLASIKPVAGLILHR